MHEEALENTVLQLRVRDVLWLSANGALVGENTKLNETMQCQCKACYTVCKGTLKYLRKQALSQELPFQTHLFIATAPRLK